MARYILKPGYELCGWKGVPFALRFPNIQNADFFTKEQYEIVLAMDGRHEIDPAALTEAQTKIFERLQKIEAIEECDENARLEPWQEYKFFPAMYKEDVQWSITGRCNYNCRHCFMSAPDYKGEDLTLEQSIYILDELQRCGIRIISVTGGEALVNPHFWDIMDEIRKRRMFMTTLYTNGELLTPQVLDEFEKRNMRPAIHMSFDGVGWHDWLRGIDGAEEAVKRAFILCKERGFQTSASMCLHKHNLGTLRDTVNLLAELGAVHLKMNNTAAEGRWANEKEHFITQDEANQAVVDYLPQYVEDGMPMSVQFCGLIEFDKRRKRIIIPFERFSGKEKAGNASACGVVRRNMYIGPNGAVLPCMTIGGTAIESKFDSVLDKPLSEILTDSYLRETSMLKMGKCIEHNEKCRTCDYKYICGAGCRACACAGGKTDFLGIDNDACDFFLHGWFEKAAELVKKYQPLMTGEEDSGSASEEKEA